MKRYYGVDFDKQREKLLNSDIAKPLINDLIKKADDAIKTSYEVLKMSDYCLFEKTGDRIFEKKYFERRNNCSYISIALWLTHDEKYIDPLINHIFMICDEFAWCVPAHARMDTNPAIEDMIERVDLFSALTARLLTDVMAAVEEFLPYYVFERVEYEIRRRIINPMYKIGDIYDSSFSVNRNFFWLRSSDNWAGVCSAGVGVALIHFGTTDEIERFLPLLKDAADRFLSGYKEDGCCVEGYNYWNFGFGNFLIFARLIKDYTNGEIDYFKDEKVKKIAMYPQRIRMGNTKIVKFSDNPNSDFSFSIGAMSFLKSVYKDDFNLPELSLGTMRGNTYAIKEFLWFDTEYKADELKNVTTYFDQTQWFVLNSEKFSFAAKGGHNMEAHNHNDVGSFMIVVGDEVPIDDLGCGIYNKDNFSDKRYSIITNGSHGHSVPIINGSYQLSGEEYCAKNVKGYENHFSLDIEGAYEKGIIDKIHRSFEIEKDYIILKDTFIYSGKTKSVTERMVSKIKPQIGDGFVDFKTVIVNFDKERYSVSVSSEVYKSQLLKADEVAYLVDFIPVNEKETEFEVKIAVKGVKADE